MHTDGEQQQPVEEEEHDELKTEAGGRSTSSGSQRMRAKQKRHQSAAKLKASKQSRAAQARQRQHQAEAAESAAKRGQAEAASASGGNPSASSLSDECVDVDGSFDDWGSEDDEEGGEGASFKVAADCLPPPVAAANVAFPLTADYEQWSAEQREACIDGIAAELRGRCSREGTSPGDPTSLYVPAGVPGSGGGRRRGGANVESSDSSCARPGTDAKSWFAGADSVTAFFLDDFLYSRTEFTRLIDQGSLHIFYCTRCHRVLQGDCRKKPQTQRDKEEADRRKQCDEIRRASKEEQRRKRKERRAARATADGQSTAAAAAAGSTLSASAASAPVTVATTTAASVISAVTSTVIGSLANAFASLAAADEDGNDEHEDNDNDQDDGTDSDAEGAAAAQSALAAALAAVAPVSPYLYPRNNAQPRYCCYCHAPSGSIGVRTHLTHSLSIRQSADMFERLVGPHVDWAEGIGAAAAKSAVKSSVKNATKSSTSDAAMSSSAAIDSSSTASPFSYSAPGLPCATSPTAILPASLYSVDIGSRLGNQLFSGLLRSRCPRWVGVELDPFFAAESRRVSRRWGMGGGRVRVLRADVSGCTDLLRGAKLVCFFNCFELHVSRSRHRELLQWLRDAVSQRGQWLLVCPALEDIYARAESEVEVEQWVQRVDSHDDAFLYRVK